MTETAPTETAQTEMLVAEPAEASALTTVRRRASFNPLAVAEVRRLTPDAVEVTFAVPENLVGEYDYLAGQYVALRTTIDGQDVRRSYSICAEPQPGEIRIAIKRDLGGIFSTWANEHLKPGDVLQVMSPQGAFISRHAMTGLNHPDEIQAEIARTPAASFVAFAAGSGITPIIAIAKTALAASSSTHFDLVYANKSAMDVMFLEDLADLKDRYPARFAVHHVLSREQRISPLMTGRIDAEKMAWIFERVLQADDVDEWFLCGPFELVQLCRDTLTARGVPAERVRYELFTTGDPQKPEGNVGRPVLVDESARNIEITFTLDGLQGTVASPAHAQESILNAALRVRPDVPFACAGGVCGTCRAKLISGTVQMAENYALEPDEIEKGFVLTCQSHPTSEAVMVDYDA